MRATLHCSGRPWHAPDGVTVTAPTPDLQAIAADAFLVPKPFKCFAVRSEQAVHATQARSPYGWVHRVPTRFLDPTALASLAALGQARMTISAFSDIDYAPVTLDELAAAAPGVSDLAGQIGAALQSTGVLGADLDGYRRSVAARIDYLAAWGAGFHNDVSRHWTGCLFWNLTLLATDVEFVMPHAGLRLALQPGDLVVFDPAMAHGLCRPRDRGQAVAASFESGDSCQQIFLSGELALSDARWAALGSPWLEVEAHAQRGALDLMVAEFDEQSGAIQRLSALANCMLRSTCYVDEVQALPQD